MAVTTHGMSRTPEYKIWSVMLQRCHNPNAQGYPYYGARGISVCERWRESFAEFIADVGRRPSAEHSLDRIENDGNYEPGNCRWATPKEQANNRRPIKLSALDVDHIRILSNQGWMRGVLAKLFDVSQGHISEIALGTTRMTY